MTMEQSPINPQNKDQSILLRVFNKLLPPYEPRIVIKDKLVEGESQIENAVIRHYSELQFVIGLIFIIIGSILPSFTFGYLYFLLITGVIIIITAYELEEIIITNRRILIRRIGIIERILRIPTDEEHAIQHIVSYYVGRAPVNVIVTIIALLGYPVIFSENISEIIKLIIMVSATIVLGFGLRLNRRALTINLAGGYQIILGLRKGIPISIIEAIQTVVFSGKDEENFFETKSGDDDIEEIDEKSVK